MLDNTKDYIQTIGAPVFSIPRWLHPKLLEAMEKEFRFFVKQEIYRPSKFSLASPIHVVPKSKGTHRVCEDYPRLNSITLADKYSIPHIHDITNVLHKQTFSLEIYIVRLYYDNPINEHGYTWNNFAKPIKNFQFLFLPFGLKCPPIAYQRFMNEVFSRFGFCCFTLDNVLIFSENEIEHAEHGEINL